jgi:hypothetical protein
MAKRANKKPIYDLTMPRWYYDQAQAQAKDLGLSVEDYARASLLDDSNTEALLEWARKMIRIADIRIIVQPDGDPLRETAIDVGLDD